MQLAYTHCTCTCVWVDSTASAGTIVAWHNVFGILPFTGNVVRSSCDSAAPVLLAVSVDW